MKISSVNEDVIWHKRRKFYSFITACKNGTNLFSKDVISKWTRRSVFLLKSCLQILKTTECQLTEYQLNNDVTITSFCFVNKSCLANSLFSNKMERLRMLQKWLSSGLHAAHWPDFIDKDSWSPSSPDMNPLDYHVWGSMLQNFCHLSSPESAAEGHPGTEDRVVKICDELPQDAICKSIANFRKCLRACVNADGGHFGQLL